LFGVLLLVVRLMVFAAGFPAMKGNVAFLMKEVVLLAVSVYLLKQGVVRASRGVGEQRDRREAGDFRAWTVKQVAAWG
jgi:hypothetical protein